MHMRLNINTGIYIWTRMYVMQPEIKKGEKSTAILVLSSLTTGLNALQQQSFLCCRYNSLLLKQLLGRASLVWVFLRECCWMWHPPASKWFPTVQFQQTKKKKEGKKKKNKLKIISFIYLYYIILYYYNTTYYIIKWHVVIIIKQNIVESISWCKVNPFGCSIGMYQLCLLMHYVQGGSRQSPIIIKINIC